MGLTVTGSMNLSGIEELSTGMAYANTAKDKVTIDKLSTALPQLTGTTTPPATKQAAGQLAMVIGAATLNLRTLVAPGGAALDGNGLKLQVWKFRAKADNVNPITIVGGAANGYLIFGAAGSIVLNPGDEIMGYMPAHLPAIDDTHKEIDISGTGSQVLEYHLILG